MTLANVPQIKNRTFSKLPPQRDLEHTSLFSTLAHVEYCTYKAHRGKEFSLLEACGSWRRKTLYPNVFYCFIVLNLFKKKINR